jgi:hypothetical protein
MAPSGAGPPVNFAEGVKDDIARIIAFAEADPKVSVKEVEQLKLRLARLLLECRDNLYLGELMGPGRHPGLVDCRRVRFDVASHVGRPRFRLIYVNRPADGAPAECRWLAVGPRVGLVAHRAAEERVPTE